jgi:hypothetical protein
LLCSGNRLGLIKRELGGASPDICQQLGQFIPFANTKAERLAVSDPRLSIEERYASQGHYVRAAEEAAGALVRQRFLLIEDYDPARLRLRCRRDRPLENSALKGRGMLKQLDQPTEGDTGGD